METQILNSSGNQVPVDAKTWVATTTAYLESTYKTQGQDAAQLQALSSAESDRLITEAIAAGGVGLAAVVVSVFLLVWFGRKVTRELGGLNASVREMAEERLPGSSPGSAGRGRGRPHGITAAGHEHHQGGRHDRRVLRHGAGSGGRGGGRPGAAAQGRQPGLPEHLHAQSVATAPAAEDAGLDGAPHQRFDRTRRALPPRPPDYPHAQARGGLIILAGSTPGRGWRGPVPVVDVLRAAVAEVEDYVRVDVTSESRDLVAGNAVNDHPPHR